MPLALRDKLDAVQVSPDELVSYFRSLLHLDTSFDAVAGPYPDGRDQVPRSEEIDATIATYFWEKNQYDIWQNKMRRALFGGIHDFPSKRLEAYLNTDELLTFALSTWKEREYPARSRYKFVPSPHQMPRHFDHEFEYGTEWRKGPSDIRGPDSTKKYTLSLKEHTEHPLHAKLNPYDPDTLEERLSAIPDEVWEPVCKILVKPISRKVKLLKGTCQADYEEGRFYHPFLTNQGYEGHADYHGEMLFTAAHDLLRDGKELRPKLIYVKPDSYRSRRTDPAPAATPEKKVEPEKPDDTGQQLELF